MCYNKTQVYFNDSYKIILNIQPKALKYPRLLHSWYSKRIQSIHHVLYYPSNTILKLTKILEVMQSKPYSKNEENEI